MSNDNPSPLEGVKIIEFGHYIAVPAATQILADLGADVVKVEAPTGDQARQVGSFGTGIIRAFNRGKRSVALDLNEDADCKLAVDLAKSGDAIVQNMRPGVLERFGLDYGSLVADRPDLIYVSVSGYGPDVPSADRPGLDIAGQAESGLMSVTGEADRDPQRVGFPVVDAATSYAAVQAVMVGLYRRDHHGIGSNIHVNLLDVGVHLQSTLWGEWSVTGRPPSRSGNGQPTVAPAADLIHTADGMVVLSAYTAPRFKKLCEILGKPHLQDDPRFVDNRGRVENRQQLLAEIEDVFGNLETTAVMQTLTEGGMVVAQVRSYEEVASSSDLTEGRLLVSGYDDGHAFSVPGLPYAIDGFEPPDGQHVPHVGQHTEGERGFLKADPAE